MKKLLQLILILGLLLPVQFADAAVSCTSIKSKIQVIEKKILAEMKFFQSLPQDKDGQGGILELTDNRLSDFRKKTWLYDVWKLGTNNPKCFTNTQKIALKDTKFKDSYTYVKSNWGSILEYPYTMVDFVWFPTKYQSIYKY